MSCECGYDQPEFYHKNMVKARKQHRCDECNCTIAPGEQYEVVRAKWEDVQTFKTCSGCLGLLAWVKAHIPCVCWCHNNMLDDLAETVDMFWHETVGLKFGFLRRRYKIEEKANHDRAKRIIAKQQSADARRAAD